MQFVLHTDTKELYYDNLKSTLDGGVDFTLAQQTVKSYTPVPFSIVDFDDRLPKQLPLRRLRIQLGTNCNYSCSFCIQQQYHASTRFPSIDNINDTVDLISKTTTDRCNIEFWGGEPLVYWKALRLLIERIRWIRPNARLFMISNGSLLTKDILNFLVEHRVNMLFSHDGPAYFLRGKDPTSDTAMKDLWYLTNQEYKDHKLTFGLNTVISQYNCDLFAMDAWFKQNLDIPYRYEGCVIAHAPNSIAFTKFTKEQEHILYNSIIKSVLQKEDNDVVKALSHWVLHIMRNITYHIPMTSISGKCDVLKPNSLSIDLQGNILSCHNVDSSQIVGLTKQIRDKFTITSKFKHWSKRSKCKDCYALLSCRGNCMRNDDYLHGEGCDVQKLFHSALMDATIGLLCGEVVSH